jgi:ribosomal protein S18 acetylase RimI-like enzyme
MKMISPSWETERLVVTNSILEEASRLREAFNACGYVAPWDDSFVEQPISVITELIGKSEAAAEGSPELFRMQTVRLKESGAIIGYFHLYHAMPKPEVAFISMMAIDPAYQKQAFGSELTSGLAGEIRAAGYPLIWLRVYLKNWPALRHWMKNGFTTIKEWRGDAVHSETAHAGLILERSLEAHAGETHAGETHAGETHAGETHAGSGLSS